MLNRREFVYSLSALAFAPPARLLAAQGTGESGAVELSDAEKRTLGHLCEQIIPKDEYPGALELGVVNFIDRLLKEAHPDWLAVYRTGLHSTDASAQAEHAKPFAELDPAQQIELMKKMERGQLPGLEWYGLPSGEFFQMVLSHTMQGYYGHPQWGGNRNKESWKMIGYDDFWA